MKLTAAAIAAILKVTPTHVRLLARRLGLGKKRGFGAWEFSARDLETMQARETRPGRRAKG